MLQAFPMYAYIPATDVARARRFYEQKLGLEPKATLNKSLTGRASSLWAVLRRCNPRHSSGYGCGLRLAAHPKSRRAPSRGLVQRRPKQEVADGVVYEFGEHTGCFLYATPNAGTSKREVAELRARGVEFENYDMPGQNSENGIVTAGGAKAAWFKDSEGNIMALIQSL